VLEELGFVDRNALYIRESPTFRKRISSIFSGMFQEWNQHKTKVGLVRKANILLTTRCHIAEERIHHSHRVEKLKSSDKWMSKKILIQILIQEWT
jgi:hypothetical protein